MTREEAKHIIVNKQLTTLSNKSKYEILEEYFKDLDKISTFDSTKTDAKGLNDVHELWEYESNKKIKELMKINAFTNANKHLRLFDIMGGSVQAGQLSGAPKSTSYFSRFISGNKGEQQQEKITEADKFIKEYKEIVGDMHYNGMPLSLNEKISVLNSKTSQLIGLYTTLKKKQEE
jgi:hypothetical protein